MLERDSLTPPPSSFRYLSHHLRATQGNNRATQRNNRAAQGNNRATTPPYEWAQSPRPVSATVPQLHMACLSCLTDLEYLPWCFLASHRCVSLLFRDPKVLSHTYSYHPFSHLCRLSPDPISEPHGIPRGLQHRFKPVIIDIQVLPNAT